MPLLTIPEAAKLLAISPHTLHAHRRKGAIVCVKVFGAWRVERSVLERFVERSRVVIQQPEDQATEKLKARKQSQPQYRLFSPKPPRPKALPSAR